MSIPTPSATSLNPHTAGVHIATELAKRIIWFSPFDTASILDRDVGVVSVALQSGPITIVAGTCMLQGLFRKEAGEGVFASVEVEHKSTVVLVVVQQPDLKPAEEMEFAQIISVALKALGGGDAKAVSIPLDRPGKAFRYTWPYSRQDNPRGL